MFRLSAEGMRLVTLPSFTGLMDSRYGFQLRTVMAKAPMLDNLCGKSYLSAIYCILNIVFCDCFAVRMTRAASFFSAKSSLSLP